jgi:hypothetical protein
MTETSLNIIYQYVLRTFAETGKPPSVDQLGQDFALDQADALMQVEMLEKQGCLYRDSASKEIVSAYPFSAVPTVHIVTFPSVHSVYAMCAIDALGMPSMLDTDASIQSACAACNASITIQIQAGQIIQVNPAEIVVIYAQGASDCCAATDQCPFINFFCSPDHAQQWQASHTHLTLKTMTLAEALAGGQRTFGNLLRGGEFRLSM